MHALDSQCLELDLHRLELRYASARLVEPRAVERLARSIDRHAQLMPCIGVAEGERVVLLDGYRRVAALKRLGRDTAFVERWGCDLAHALITVLCRSQARALAAVEEALILRELVDGLGLTQNELAQRCGRDASWVCRRLQLLSGLSENVLAAVREGTLSTWAATRVVGPLARANAEHAERLLQGVRGSPLSTRELNCWFEHYRGANQVTRERLITHPRLFLQALRESGEARALERLRAGPEGECVADCRSIQVLLVRLRKRLPRLCEPGLPEALVHALAPLRMTLEAFLPELKGYCEHDRRGDRDSGARAESPRPLGSREISRALKLSRNTVRRILRARPRGEAEYAPCDAQTLTVLQSCFERARGNGVRVRELLRDEHELEVGYSTLTRWVREAGLRAPPKRSGEYHFKPGEEGQHDTSPHRVLIGEQRVTAQCASLILAYSRRLFAQYYPHFTRFEAKHFLLEAARFNDGICPRCIIDNTSVIVAEGTGENAVFAPEMVAFARTLGFEFRAHERGHADRKGRIERPYSWIEHNFLPGRRFSDFDDLNRQLLAWCREVANPKPKRVLGMSPEAAYVIEKPYLRSLPALLPPVYEVFERVVDLYGYVSVQTNRYSAPEKFVGKTLTVYKYPAEIQIFHRGTVLATHPRLIHQRDARHTIAHHHTTPQRAPRAPALEEDLLRGAAPVLEHYAAALKQHSPRHSVRALRRLLEMKRTYPTAPFVAALEQALRFGLFDLGRLENLVLKHVAGDFFNLDSDTPDDDA